MPINGPDLWLECEFPPPLPAIYKGKVGKPAKLRRRERDEPPASSCTKLRGVKKITNVIIVGNMTIVRGHAKGQEGPARARNTTKLTASVAPQEQSKRKKTTSKHVRYINFTFFD